MPAFSGGSASRFRIERGNPHPPCEAVLLSSKGYQQALKSSPVVPKWLVHDTVRGCRPSPTASIVRSRATETFWEWIMKRDRGALVWDGARTGSIRFLEFRLDPANQCLWRRAGSGEEEGVALTP